MHLLKEYLVELLHKLRPFTDFCVRKKAAFDQHSQSWKVAAFVIALAVIVLGGILIDITFAPTGKGYEVVIIEVPLGTSLHKVVSDLEKAKLVKNRPFFYALVYLWGLGAHIKAGEYEINPRFSQVRIAKMFARGITKIYPVTFPEDWTVAQIARRLEANRLVNYKTFMALAKNATFLAEMKIPARTVEGFLYPETYNFDRTMGERRIMGVMIGQFWKVFTPQMEFRAREMGFSVREAVTLASMIGKEASIAEEKPLVSAVFHNRLRLKMRLQSDPTAVYNFEQSRRKVTKEDLQKRTKYNTYLIAGLPRGPIANPSKASLVATLYPADVDYLYFVYAQNGAHIFSNRYSDHVNAINRLRNKIGKKKQSAPAETTRG